MTGHEIRSRYVAFFEKRGHKVISSAPLVLENDSTTLFTSSGMQPLVPYLLGEPHPQGTKLVNSQPSLRVQDIEEVGDNRHTTFFEMLGNWSLGDYFKKEQLPWIFEFLTNKEEGLGLDPQRLYVSVFEGNEFVPKDEESIGLWENIFESVGIEAREGERILTYSAKKNWWSRSGTPEQMPAGEIGGPDSEIFYDFGEAFHFHEQSQWRNEPCHPNCDCGRFFEIGNSVFIQYKKQEDGSLSELPQKNVDFGGGLERLLAAVNNSPDAFGTDLFYPLISAIETVSGKTYLESPGTRSSMQVIADHLKASVFLLSYGVVPSNKQQGYVLRRLLRRAALMLRQLKGEVHLHDFSAIVTEIFHLYDGVYLDASLLPTVQERISEEISKFTKTLDSGLRLLEKRTELTGKEAFDLYQTYGFPLELTLEVAKKKGITVDEAVFQEEFAKHKDLSRTASAGMFRGGLADHSEATTKLHTATHLLQAALRRLLGDEVQQKGSNITQERLRFDFTFSRKITSEELSQVESLVNEQIEKNLPVTFTSMPFTKAKESGALAFFGTKYEETVNVYTIGDPDGDYFSKEVCGGPHVSSTGVLGHVTITKEEAVSAGVRRIYATVSS
jgi:alanyl-tRNA synthetase